MYLLKPVLAVLFLLAMLPAVWGISYDVLVQESGSSVVIATLEGAGLHTIELPPDATPEVRGALYLQEGSILNLSTGSAGKAIIAYQTKAYTAKEDSWKFNFDSNGPVKITFSRIYQEMMESQDYNIQMVGMEVLE